VRGISRRSLMNKAITQSDSVAEITESLAKCPQCGATTRLDQTTCINCFLREGLEAKGEASRETFESVLAEANVTDTQWRLGHYEILEEIGRGGMGVIYRARQQHSRRIVAVKRILAHQVNSHETLLRFRREAEAVASLDHPNILPIHEISESEEGLPYFSMKYATGGSLRTAAPALRNKPRDCVRLMAKVARGIAYAHSKGVLHRDLQPGNILLDENGEPMVSDFGLAKWLDQGSDLTRTLETLGTPGYIAPEQTECPANKLTPAVDIYSLGAIGFYLLTGRPPFVGSNVLHVIHQAATAPAPRLRSLAPSLDRDLETIITRCLESDSKARYQSAGALADDLEHWLRNEPIQARHTGVFTRGRKWVRRNPTSTVLMASLVALAAAIVAILWEKESPRPLPVLPAGVAVLPFENLSADPENASFTDGVQDEILNDLTKISDLKVISRTSVMQYKAGVKRDVRQIGNELGVTHVVEGSVQRAANRIRVTAQLIDIKTDRHLWVEHYDRPLDDVFAIQSDIAKAIATRLQAKLSSKEKAAIEERPTSDLAAYDLYSKARELMYNARFNPARREKGLFKAVELLDQAVARDPTFLLAHCQLAFANDQIYFANYDHTETRLALAESSVEAAVRLQPNAGETHLAQANHFFWGYLNYPRAREELAKAQRELPNNAEVFRVFGQMNRWEGHWEEARQNLERAVELDPRNTRTITDLAWVYIALRRYEEADALAIRLQALEPRSPTLRAGRAFIGLEARADMASLRAVLNTIESESPQSATEVADLSFRLALFERDPTKAARALANMPREGKIDANGEVFPHTWYEGLLAKLRQDTATAHSAFTAARAETEKLVHVQPRNERALGVLALIDAELGDKEKAIREERTACDMLPPTKNALDGVWLMMNLARIYALTGEKDLALELLEVLSKLASSWFGISYGELRLNPDWDSLRGDARFEKLLEEVKKPLALESPPPVPAGIAVLPFENLSTDPENAFFADGVQDEILNDLAKIADLKVISRTSVMQYKSGAKRNLRQIASELGVAHVVEGSVQRAANRVRVSAQLIDARTDNHLWAERYDRPLDDVFAIQSEIAKAIAAQLQAKLSPVEKIAIEQPPTTNLVAYDRYLRAKKLGAVQTASVPREIREVTRLLDQAVAYDPSFLLAYCELAKAHAYAYHLGVDRTPARVALAKAARDAALRLGPDRGESHLAAADVAFHCDLDYETGLKEVAIARRTLPNDAFVFALPAYIHRRQGHWEHCASDLEHAVELDPRNVWLLQDAAQTYQFERRFSEAAAAWDRALAVAPGDPNTRLWRALVDLDSRADTQPMHEVIQQIVTEDPSAVDAIAEHSFFLALCRRDAAEMTRALASLPPEGIIRRDLLMPPSFCDGLVARATNDATRAEKAFAAARAEMEKVVREQPDYAQALCVLGMSDAALGHKEDAIREGRRAVELLPVTKDAMAGAVVLTKLAIIYAWTGEKDLALEQLAIAIRFPSSNFLSYGQLRLHPFWDPLRNDPRFEKLAEEMKKPVALKYL
jgi:TolB-like protein/Tfp pilus assembly protein PilF/tRNA A-37 threonylcarbamoyl transferase component Bud32